MGRWVYKGGRSGLMFWNDDIPKSNSKGSTVGYGDGSLWDGV
jgi:hypothetical protein